MDSRWRNIQALRGIFESGTCNFAKSPPTPGHAGLNSRQAGWRGNTGRRDQPEGLIRHMGMNWWTEQAEGLQGRIDRGEPLKWFAPHVDGPPTA